MGAREAIASLGAVAFIVLASIPYSPTLVYEGRYLIVDFANPLPDVPVHFSAFDTTDGVFVAGFFDWKREAQVLPPDIIMSPWGDIHWGAWGPSHGPWSLLENGYPAPYLNERTVRVEGGEFAVRVWEGAGVQADCNAAIAGAALQPFRHTGSGQGWGPREAPMGYPRDSNAHFDRWEQTRWLTCVWVVYLGSEAGAANGVPFVIE